MALISEQHESRPSARTWATATVVVLVAYDLMASVIGLVAKLPDLPATHARTTRLTLSQVFFTDGTIMSPPLVLMVLVLLLLWGSTAARAWVARGCGLLLLVGIVAMTADEAAGFNDKPALYTSAKWDLALTIGIGFAVLGIAAVTSLTTWLWTSTRSSTRGA